MKIVPAPTAPSLPLWWSRSFRGRPSQVSEARSWLAGLLPACEALDDLLILTSELAANAITHTRSGQPGGWFTLELTLSPQTARVVVGDQGSDGIPARQAPSEGGAASREHGRGLVLIDAISAAWGMAGGPRGRWLWAEADWRSRGGPLPTGPVGDSVARQFAAIRRAHPGTSPWYSSETGHWHATLPAVSGGVLTAPSPGALASMLRSRKPPARNHQTPAGRPPPGASGNERIASIPAASC